MAKDPLDSFKKAICGGIKPWKIRKTFEGRLFTGCEFYFIDEELDPFHVYVDVEGMATIHCDPHKYITIDADTLQEVAYLVDDCKLIILKHKTNLEIRRAKRARNKAKEQGAA